MVRSLQYFFLFCIKYICFFFNDTATTEIYTLSLHDALPISLENIDINNDFRTKEEILKDIDNKINIVKSALNSINNKFNSSIRVLKDIFNLFAWVKAKIFTFDNKFNSQKKILNNISNDFRMLSAWQLPGAGEIGFQSVGKEYVKVYINSIEQTDVDVDSVIINQVLNGASFASFNLGRAYDDTKPNIKSSVEIKYHVWSLFKGYITKIESTNSPEVIKINCYDEYWNENNNKKYLFVGRKPEDTNELYYTTIKSFSNFRYIF